VQSGESGRLWRGDVPSYFRSTLRAHRDSVVADFVRGAVLGPKDGARRSYTHEVSSVPAEAGLEGLCGCGAFIASRLVLMSTRSEAHSEGVDARYMALPFEVLRGDVTAGALAIFEGLRSFAAARCSAFARPSF